MKMTEKDEREGDEAEVAWEGDCLEVVRAFPKPVRRTWVRIYDACKWE
jgi:hypothetical protein